MQDDAVVVLSEIGSRTSLRYALQLLTPARILATANATDGISKIDVEETDKLFFDAKRSARLLSERKDKYLM